MREWERYKIYTLQVNEIENLLCDEIILNKAIERFCCTDDTLDNFKEGFFATLDIEKEKQSVWYTKTIINNILKSNMLEEERSIDVLNNEFTESINSIDIDDIYNEKLNELQEIINKKDYNKALEVANFKGGLIRGLANKFIVSNYKDRIFGLISDDEEL